VFYVRRIPVLAFGHRPFARYTLVAVTVLVGLAAALETMPFEERWLG
jgi:hypothetical protein